MFAEDLDVFLADFGSSVNAGAIVGLGFMDRQSQLVMGDHVVTVDYALTVRTDLFGLLQYGAQIEYEGQAYRLQHEPTRIGDGRFCVLMLELIDPPIPPLPINSLLLEDDGLIQLEE